MTKTLARGILIVIIGLSILAGWAIKDLRFNYDFESFFPKDDPELTFYFKFRESLSTDYEFFLIGIEAENSVFEPEFLQKVASLTDTLAKLDLITAVQSPTNAFSFINGPLGPIKVPYLHPNQPEKLFKDSIRVNSTEHLIGTLFAEDGKSVAILAETEANLSKEKSDLLAKTLNALLPSYQFKETHVAGRIFGQLYYIERMKTELALFMSISIGLLIVVLFFMFRTFWGIWVPLVVVLLTALWLLAIMAITNKPIDLMTALLPTILFVVGMSDVIHIISKYLEELKKGASKRAALGVTFKEIGAATFLTSLTTAIGFLTLMSGSIVPIQEFGLYTAIGVFLAFLLAFSLLPAILFLSPMPKEEKAGANIQLWTRMLRGIYLFSTKKHRQIIAFTAGLVVVLMFIIPNLKLDNYLLEDLSKNDPHRQDFEFFENQFAGVRPFELAVNYKGQPEEMLEFEQIQTLVQIENYLTKTYGVNQLMSVLTPIKFANQMNNGGKAEAFAVPSSIEEYNQIKPIINRLVRMNPFKGYLLEAENYYRFSGKMKDIGGHENRIRKLQLDQDFGTMLNIQKWGWQVTGMAWLIDLNNTSLSRDMLLGLLIAFVVIGIIMGLLFRSFKLAFISLIPNVLPLMVVAAFMVVVGIDLKISTSIIFTIAFGIAVDDTIHYMSKLKLELQKGKSMLYALKRTTLSTGKAIALTTLVLLCGFITLLFSTFGSTYYIGLLVGLTLLLALFADLLLLPALLVMFATSAHPRPKPQVKLNT